MLRFNRLGANVKDYIKFPDKKCKTGRDYFDVCFKALMLCEDTMDVIAYLMQLKVIKEGNMLLLRKHISNLYFYECVVWSSLHIYELLTKKDIKTPKDSLKKKLYILKYILDSLTSHNDFSGRKFTFSLKVNTIIGLVSSLVGMILVWM